MVLASATISVQLKDFQIDKYVRSFVPKKGIEIQWKQSEEDKKNNEGFATLISSNKKILDQQAAEMIILSERCRTLKNLPKFRMINTKTERII